MINKSKKRIAIIAHPLHAGGGISVGRNFIAALGQIAPENQYLVSIPSGLGYETICADLPHCQTLIFSDRSSLCKRWWWETRILRPVVKKFNPDLVFALANRGLGGMKCPEAILCHNSHIWYPTSHYGEYSFLDMSFIKVKRWIRRRYLQNDLKQTHNILLYQTVTARERIGQTFNLQSHAVFCPNAVSKFAAINDQVPPMPDEMRPYSGRFKMFFVTRYYPHKNIEAIIELFRNYREDLHDCVVFLTISSDQGPGAKRLLNAITLHGLQNNIINVGPLGQEELGAWFSHSQALLMPTLLESFSGTYLEAMHFGVPILTSDLDFAHEICLDAAIYFDPWNTESIRDAIISLRDNPDHAYKIKEFGRRRIKEMQNSWLDIVQKILTEIKFIQPLR